MNGTIALKRRAWTNGAPEETCTSWPLHQVAARGHLVKWPRRTRLLNLPNDEHALSPEARKACPRTGRCNLGRMRVQPAFASQTNGCSTRDTTETRSRVRTASAPSAVQPVIMRGNALSAIRAKRIMPRTNPRASSVRIAKNTRLLSFFSRLAGHTGAAPGLSCTHALARSYTRT
jgi:hypothetical protein